MSWGHTFTRTSEPRPYDSVLFCGICHVEVHVTRNDAALSWIDAMTLARRAEGAAVAHLSAEHPIRYWLWQRLGWRWLVGGLAG